MLAECADNQSRARPRELAKPRPCSRRDQSGEAAQDAVEHVRVGCDELELAVAGLDAKVQPRRLHRDWVQPRPHAQCPHAR